MSRTAAVQLQTVSIDPSRRQSTRFAVNQRRMEERSVTNRKWLGCGALLIVIGTLILGGCASSSSSPPPSSSPPSSSPPSSSPPAGSQSPQMPGGTPPPGGESQGTPPGSQADGTLPGTESQPTWEESQQAGGGAEGADSQPAGTAPDNWESGLPSAVGEGWETSNQLPGDGDSRMPPMPSERGLPPGQGDADGEATAQGAGQPGLPGGDGELDEALEDFDGEILAERAVIQARSNETAGTSQQPAGLPGTGDSGGDASGLPEGSPTYQPRQMPTSQSNGSDGPPMGGVSGGASAQIPENLPDARDDDIIARQLREAAMNESDPELQEKLWEEYRRYKGA